MVTILYIEDEEDMVELVKRNLERAGYLMIHASSGEEGLRLAESERPGLILLAIGLGVDRLDGWLVNRKLKSNSATSAMPVIALTAHTTRIASRERALSEGFVDQFNKPVDFPTLIASIHKLVTKLATGGAS